MDLRQLQYFLTAVESRSFGKAAEKLHVTQPALSKAVRRLELSLGVKLLDRLPRGVSPTIYGEALAAHADLIKGEIQRARDAIFALKDGNTGRVVVGAGSSMRLELVPEACVRLQSRHPDVEIKLIGELYDDLIPDLARGEIDLALSMVPENDDNPDLIHEPLYLDQTHPVVRVGHPLLMKKKITAEDCLEYDWILPGQDNLGRRHLDSFYLAKKLPVPKPIIDSNSTLFAVSVIRKSDFIGWHPTQVIGDSKMTGLKALPVPDITLTRTVGISYRRTSVLSPAALLLIGELKAVGADMIARNLVMPLRV
jgi:DNA-binding transcriptional LysR family regulator